MHQQVLSKNELCYGEIESSFFKNLSNKFQMKKQQNNSDLGVFFLSLRRKFARNSSTFYCVYVFRLK